MKIQDIQRLEQVKDNLVEDLLSKFEISEEIARLLAERAVESIESRIEVLNG